MSTPAAERLAELEQHIEHLQKKCDALGAANVAEFIDSLFENPDFEGTHNIDPEFVANILRAWAIYMPEAPKP